MNRVKLFAVLLTVALCVCACQSGSRVRMAPDYESTATPPGRPAIGSTRLPTGTPLPFTPTPLTLSDSRYTLPSGALDFYPPHGWTLASERDEFARFISTDASAWLEVAVESSGYELDPDGFTAYTEAMLASLYTGAAGYRRLDYQTDLGSVRVTSTLMSGEHSWQSLDFFLQRGEALYLFSFHALESVWWNFQPAFEQLLASVQTTAGYVTADWAYRLRNTFREAGGAYSLGVPLGWQLSTDTAAIENGTLTAITSPDGEAQVQSIRLDASAMLEQKDIGQITVGVLNDLEGSGLRVLASDAQDDNRFRLDWQVDATGIRGFTFMWLEGNHLHILTLRHAPQHTALYSQVLDQISASFMYLYP